MDRETTTLAPHKDFGKIRIAPFTESDFHSFDSALKHFGLNKDQSFIRYDFTPTHYDHTTSGLPQEKSTQRRQNRLEFYQSLLEFADNGPELINQFGTDAICMGETHDQFFQFLIDQQLDGVNLGIHPTKEGTYRKFNQIENAEKTVFFTTLGEQINGLQESRQIIEKKIQETQDKLVSKARTSV